MKVLIVILLVALPSLSKAECETWEGVGFEQCVTADNVVGACAAGVSGNYCRAEGFTGDGDGGQGGNDRQPPVAPSNLQMMASGNSTNLKACMNQAVTQNCTNSKAAPITVTNFDSYSTCKNIRLAGVEVFSKSYNYKEGQGNLNDLVCGIVNSDPTSKVACAATNQDKTQCAALTNIAVTGLQKCAAIMSAGWNTTEFQEDGKVASMDGKVSCKKSDGTAFDYPSCKSFITWYNGLLAAQSGMTMYNETSKSMTNMKAQSEMQQQTSQGNGQTAGLDASQKVTGASADAEGRNKVFFMAKAGAIGAQLATFTTPGNVDCGNTDCCALFTKGGQDGIRNTASFFPNQGVKATMMAEVIKAGGDAALAAMKEAELNRQKNLLGAVKNQIAPPDATNDPAGFMAYCQQFPQSVQCQTGGSMSAVGSGFSAPSFSMDGMGMQDMGFTGTDIKEDEGTLGAAAGPTGPGVNNIGSMDSDAKAAKDIFNAPPAASPGAGGAGGAAGGAGGASASASAPGLSKDPGLDANKDKPADQDVTKAGASYNSASYNGGAWQNGKSNKNEANAANPFASLFGDQKRGPAETADIDSPASDLFTKISNRYNEVQKRNGLMEVK